MPRKQTVAHGIQLLELEVASDSDSDSNSDTNYDSPSLARSRCRAEPIFNCATAKKATAGDASAMKANASDSPWHAVSLTRYVRVARGMNNEGGNYSSVNFSLYT